MQEPNRIVHIFGQLFLLKIQFIVIKHIFKLIKIIIIYRRLLNSDCLKTHLHLKIHIQLIFSF